MKLIKKLRKKAVLLSICELYKSNRKSGITDMSVSAIAIAKNLNQNLNEKFYQKSYLIWPFLIRGTFTT